MFDCKRVRKVSPWVNILVVSWISRVGPVITGVILATCWLHLQISTDYIGLASDGSQNENVFNIYIYRNDKTCTYTYYMYNDSPNGGEISMVPTNYKLYQTHFQLYYASNYR
jgi:hypothetical protein